MIPLKRGSDITISAMTKTTGKISKRATAANYLKLLEFEATILNFSILLTVSYSISGVFFDLLISPKECVRFLYDKSGSFNIYISFIDD